jgi:YggT family protein
MNSLRRRRGAILVAPASLGDAVRVNPQTPWSPVVNIVLYVVYIAIMVYGWLIIGRAVLSWFPLPPGNPLFRVRGVLVWLTEPYLRLFRRFIPMARVGGVGLDVSAMVGLIALLIVSQVIARIG